MGNGFGPAGAVKEVALTVDLDKTANILPNLFQPGQDYQWGILLVELNPYRRLRYLGGDHKFSFEQTNGDSGSNDGSNSPASTNTPRG